MNQIGNWLPLKIYVSPTPLICTPPTNLAPTPSTMAPSYWPLSPPPPNSLAPSPAHPTLTPSYLRLIILCLLLSWLVCVLMVKDFLTLLPVRCLPIRRNVVSTTLVPTLCVCGMCVCVCVCVCVW